ncbi:MAG: glycosyltransferase [Nitrospinaceae bacterium]|nr:glycosyltransferase [Nitrospinaceae bacterium]
MMISHACAASINRGKMKNLAKRQGLEMSLLVPRLWREGERELVTEPGEGEGYPLHAGDVFFSGRVGGHVYRSGLLGALKRERPDIVHIEEEPWSLAVAQLLSFLPLCRPRPKLVLFSFENMDIPLHRLQRTIEHRALSRADVLIAGGVTVRERLLARGARPEHVVVLPQFGLDPELFKPPVGERPDVFTVGFVGRLVHEKGVDLMIRALFELKGQWRAIVVGDGPERGKLESMLRELGLSDRIEFAGWVDHFEIPGFLQRLHTLVLPSRSVERWKEQFGHVLIEAMSAGAVAVGSNSGEIPHVIGDEGLIFPEDDVNALAGHLQKLLDEPKFRGRLSTLGRQRVVREYGWSAFAEKTHEIYERAMVAQKLNAPEGDA